MKCQWCASLCLESAEPGGFGHNETFLGNCATKGAHSARLSSTSWNVSSKWTEKKTKERTLLIDMKHRWHCLFSTLQRVLRSFRRFYPNMLIATEPRRWWSTSSFPLCACELVRLLHTYIVQLTAKYISGVMSHVYDRWGADLHLHFFWFCSRNFSLLMFSIAVAALDCCCCCGIFFF